MADFIPKDELDSFLKKADAVTSGAAVEASEDFEKHKLDESNLGWARATTPGISPPPLPLTPRPPLRPGIKCYSSTAGSKARAWGRRKAA